MDGSHVCNQNNRYFLSKELKSFVIQNFEKTEIILIISMLCFRTALESYMPKVFILLFHRLQNSKTTKFVKSLLEFFSLFAVKNSGSTLIDVIDGIQPK